MAFKRFKPQVRRDRGDIHQPLRHPGRPQVLDYSPAALFFSCASQMLLQLVQTRGDSLRKGKGRGRCFCPSVTTTLGSTCCGSDAPCTLSTLLIPFPGTDLVPCSVKSLTCTLHTLGLQHGATFGVISLLPCGVWVLAPRNALCWVNPVLLSGKLDVARLETANLQ